MALSEEKLSQLCRDSVEREEYQSEKEERLERLKILLEKNRTIKEKLVVKREALAKKKIDLREINTHIEGKEKAIKDLQDEIKGIEENLLSLEVAMAILACLDTLLPATSSNVTTNVPVTTAIYTTHITSSDSVVENRYAHFTNSNYSKKVDAGRLTQPEQKTIQSQPPSPGRNFGRGG